MSIQFEANYRESTIFLRWNDIKLARKVLENAFYYALANLTSNYEYTFQLFLSLPSARCFFMFYCLSCALLQVYDGKMKYLPIV